jgi:hypothetical protein
MHDRIMFKASHGCSLAFLALLASGFVVGCNNKDAAKCSEAQQVTRQALAGKNFDLAKQWREYAYKQCEDTSQLAQLDKEIIERQAAVEKAARDEAAKKAQQQQLLTLFKNWVGQVRTAPERGVTHVSCEGGDDEKLKTKKERFCSGARAVTGMEGASLQARFWEKTPADVALYSVRLPLPATCADLGGHTVLKSTDVPTNIVGRTVKRYHCDLTDAGLSGLQALATEANSAELRVFTVKYPEQDPALRFQLK